MGRKNRRKTIYIRRVPKIPEIVKPKRMDVWYAWLPMNRKTSVQGGSRPVVIISNDICNERSETLTVLPLTTQIKHTGMPTHVLVGSLEEGCPESMVLAEQVMTIGKSQLGRKVGNIALFSSEIERALLEQVGIGR